MILHQHKGSNIIFSAWEGKTPFNNREYSINRNSVLRSVDFYREYHNKLEWLVETGLLESKLTKE
jgi:hypothetical protein